MALQLTPEQKTILIRIQMVADKHISAGKFSVDGRNPKKSLKFLWEKVLNKQGPLASNVYMAAKQVWDEHNNLHPDKDLGPWRPIRPQPVQPAMPTTVRQHAETAKQEFEKIPKKFGFTFLAIGWVFIALGTLIGGGFALIAAVLLTPMMFIGGVIYNSGDLKKGIGHAIVPLLLLLLAWLIPTVAFILLIIILIIGAFWGLAQIRAIVPTGLQWIFSPLTLIPAAIVVMLVICGFNIFAGLVGGVTPPGYTPQQLDDFGQSMRTAFPHYDIPPPRIDADPTPVPSPTPRGPKWTATSDDSVGAEVIFALGEVGIIGSLVYENADPSDPDVDTYFSEMLKCWQKYSPGGKRDLCVKRYQDRIRGFRQ